MNNTKFSVYLVDSYEDGTGLTFKLLNRDIYYGGGDVHSVSFVEEQQQFAYDGKNIFNYIKDEYIKEEHREEQQKLYNYKYKNENDSESDNDK